MTMLPRACPMVTQGNCIALIPASHLGAIEDWQECARRLPQGGILLVLPENNQYLQGVGRRIKDTLDRQGRQVTLTSTR